MKTETAEECLKKLIRIDKMFTAMRLKLFVVEIYSPFERGTFAAHLYVLWIKREEKIKIKILNDYAKQKAVEFAVHMCYKLIDEKGNFDTGKADSDFYDQWIKDNQ